MVSTNTPVSCNATKLHTYCRWSGFFAALRTSLRVTVRHLVLATAIGALAVNSSLAFGFYSLGRFHRKSPAVKRVGCILCVSDYECLGPLQGPFHRSHQPTSDSLCKSATDPHSPTQKDCDGIDPSWLAAGANATPTSKPFSVVVLRRFHRIGTLAPRLQSKRTGQAWLPAWRGIRDVPTTPPILATLCVSQWPRGFD